MKYIGLSERGENPVSQAQVRGLAFYQFGSSRKQMPEWNYVCRIFTEKNISEESRGENTGRCREHWGHDGHLTARSKRRRVWRQKDWVGGISASLSLWDHPDHIDREPQGPVCAFEASPLSRKSQLALIPLGPGLGCEPRRTWCMCEHCVNPTVATALCRDLSWMGI